MKSKLLPFLAVILAAVGAAGQQPDDSAARELLPLETSCVKCHLDLDGAALEAASQIKVDIHFQKGISCDGCHGGNPEAGFDGDLFAAHDEEMGWTEKPSRLEIPALCATCHSDAVYMKRFNPQARVDQMEEYRTSVHGMRNKEGDTNAAVCVDCHGVHGIRPVSDPQSPAAAINVAGTCAGCHTDSALMGRYGLPINQYLDYKQSVHAFALYEKDDLSAPTCNDCHGNHGAVPPGVDSITNVCGNCHGREQLLFRETETERGLDLGPALQCIICHSNHSVLPPSDEMVGIGPKSTCTPCHPSDTEEYKVIARMGEAIQGLAARLEEAEELLHKAERAGMQVSPDQYALQGAVEQLVEARALVHSFNSERLIAAADKGMEVADAGVAAGERAFEDLLHRRLGLTASLVVILAVIIALVLKVRQMERPQASSPGE